MRIAIIGAGLAGVSTAYELAREGHEVTVVERHAGLAAEASFANGGLVATSYLSAWQAPGLPQRLLGTPWRPGSSWRSGGLPPASWPFLWRWRQAHRPAAVAARRARVLRLAQLSQGRMDSLSHSLRLERERESGLLVLLRHEREWQAMQPGVAWLAEQGLAHRLLDAAEARTLEPALHPDTPLHAALHLPGDEAANSRQYVHLLKAQAQALGVRWRFLHEVLAVEPGTPLRLQLRARPDALDEAPPEAPLQVLEADAVVVCASLGAPGLLQALGLQLPVATVHGHSITAPARMLDGQHDNLPRAGLLDQRFQISMARQGDRIRVAGGAELGGRAERLSEPVLKQLYGVLDDWFPGAAHTARAIQWKGSRLLLPDGEPLVGSAGIPGVWLNTAHGASGWTLASGAALLLAEQISGRTPSIDPAGLGLERLR